MVHQYEWTVSFLYIKPVNRGHCLVVPREHHAGFHDLPPALMVPLMRSVALVSAAAMEALGADSFNVFLNNGASAAACRDQGH